MSHERLIMSLITVWPENLAIDQRTGRGSCIESSRVVSAVLARLGVAHRPLPCAVWVGNAHAVANIDAGVTSVDGWEVDAYSVGVDPDVPNTRPNLSEPFRVGGFGGHLIVVGDDWLLDMTAPQFHRPERGIHLEGAVFLGGQPLEYDSSWVVDLDGGGRLVYVPRPELASWRRTPAWRQDVPRDLVETIARHVQSHAG